MDARRDSGQRVPRRTEAQNASLLQALKALDTTAPVPTDQARMRARAATSNESCHDCLGEKAIQAEGGWLGRAKPTEPEHGQFAGTGMVAAAGRTDRVPSDKSSDTPPRALEKAMHLSAHRKRLMDEMEQRNKLLLAQLDELRQRGSLRTRIDRSPDRSTRRSQKGTQVPVSSTPVTSRQIVSPVAFESAGSLFGPPSVVWLRRTSSAPHLETTALTGDEAVLRTNLPTICRKSRKGRQKHFDVGSPRKPARACEVTEDFYYPEPGHVGNDSSPVFQPRLSAVMRAAEEREKHEAILAALCKNMHRIGVPCTSALRGVSLVLAELAADQFDSDDMWPRKLHECSLVDSIEANVMALEEEVLALQQSVAIHKRKGTATKIGRQHRMSRRRSRSLGDITALTRPSSFPLLPISECSEPDRSRLNSFVTRSISTSSCSSHSHELDIEMAANAGEEHDDNSNPAAVPHPALQKALGGLEALRVKQEIDADKVSWILFCSTFFIELVFAVTLIWLVVDHRRDSNFVAWVVCMCLVAVSVPVSVYDILHHLYDFRSPLQMHYVKIMALVPIYCFEAWLGVMFIFARRFLGCLRELYEAYVIYVFFMLLNDFLHVSRVQKSKIKASRRKRSSIRPSSVEAKLIPSVKAGIWQYVAVRVVFAVLVFVVEVTSSDLEGRFENPSNFTKIYFWQALATNACQTVALVMLCVFIGALRKHFEPLYIYRKLGTVVCVTFCPVWQKWLYAFAVFEGVVKPPFYGYRDPASFEHLLLVVELSLCTMLMRYSFSHTEFLPGGRLMRYRQQAQANLGPLAGGSVVVPIVGDVMSRNGSQESLCQADDGSHVNEQSVQSAGRGNDDLVHRTHRQDFVEDTPTKTKAQMLAWLNRVHDAGVSIQKRILPSISRGSRSARGGSETDGGSRHGHQGGPGLGRVETGGRRKASKKHEMAQV